MLSWKIVRVEAAPILYSTGPSLCAPFVDHLIRLGFDFTDVEDTRGTLVYIRGCRIVALYALRR